MTLAPMRIIWGDVIKNDGDSGKEFDQAENAKSGVILDNFHKIRCT